MTVSPVPIQADAAAHVAASSPGFDATATITAGDTRLGDYLAMPTQQILEKLGLHHPPSAATNASSSPAALANPAAATNPGGAGHPFDPAALISPVVNALGTLGNGQFSGMNPTSALDGISHAFNGIAGPVQQALSAVQPGWQGVSGAAAIAKTGAALANGADVATQASGLSSTLSTAVADVAQGQAQLIAIINEYWATFMALLPSLINPFTMPWALAKLFAAASQAVTQGGRVMTELQTSLAGHAGAVTAIGAPVALTSAPTLGSSMAGAASPLSSMLGSTSGMSALSPLMSLASAGISPAMSAASMAGNSASAGAQSAALVDDTEKDHKSPAGGAAVPGKAGGGAGPVSPGGGGGPAASGTLVSRFTAPTAPTAPEATTTAMAAGSARAPMGAMAAGGGGMMGAPFAGAGQGANNGGAHTAASYLHTSDQGGKLVGGSSTVPPPVIGEIDPNDTPDIELRI
ncbi:hypothetical protein ACQI5H_20185 [Mycobacterium heidelbergense]|uniref:hypothetical protein n=1 Tax=Mycobacterium heidelbergense TaxID=53376 RepID=UPI003CF50B8B